MIPDSISYWQQTAPTVPLSTDIPRSVDVAVIGGGLMGTATSYWLAREGVSVALLEREAIGWGAPNCCYNYRYSSSACHQFLRNVDRCAGNRSHAERVVWKSMNVSPFVIGVSGHQNLVDEATRNFVAQQFRVLLMSYQQQTPRLVLYSSLALGADQLFVRIALEQGIPVEAVLPCAEYETIFRTEEERHVYTHLLQACQQIHLLPNQQCGDAAFLAAGQWIVDHCHLMILAWNGLPPRGRGGTGDMATYARLKGRPFIHLHTVQHMVKQYGNMAVQPPSASHISPKRTFITEQQTVYQGPLLTVNQYHLCLPDGQEVVRDIVERPESVLILPVGQKDIVLLVKEYDLGAGQWQLTIPGGKVEHTHAATLEEQAQRELQQEIGYRAGRLEKLIEFYSHPGYIFHHVHVFLASNLEWDPLELEPHEEIHVQTYMLKDALDATLEDNRFDPEAALALWLYAKQKRNSERD
jgi:8-oxo-dGTP pyrophosphatase MutT (NUDIX family)